MGFWYTAKAEFVYSNDRKAENDFLIAVRTGKFKAEKPGSFVPWNEFLDKMECFEGGANVSIEYECDTTSVDVSIRSEGDSLFVLEWWNSMLGNRYLMNSSLKISCDWKIGFREYSYKDSTYYEDREEYEEDYQEMIDSIRKEKEETNEI